MSEYPDYTTSKTDAGTRIPEWARQYDEGDTIHWTHQELDGVYTSTVRGFSTMYDEAFPVIDAPKEHFERPDRDYVETVVVTEDTHFAKFEWVEHDE